MAPARYERLQEQQNDRDDDCQSEGTADSTGSERVLNDPPNRHDIWNQPWWLFLLMVLLFLGLVAASIGVHAAVCSSKPAVADPVTEAAFTKLVVRDQISTMYIGEGANTTLCSVPRLSIEGVGPAWSQASDAISVSTLNFGLGRRVLLSLSNSLKTPIDFAVQSALGADQNVDAAKIRLIGVPQADLLLAQLDAGTTTIESQRGFFRGRGLSLPMMVGGSLPTISSDYNTDLIGAIDKAKDVVFLLQDACIRSRRVNRTQNLCGDCLEISPTPLSGITEVDYGVIASNNRFEHHMHSFLVEPGVPIRLRVYNSASGTNFFLNITSDEEVFVESQVIAIDGHWIAPVDLRALKEPIWIGVGQRVDILIFFPSRRWARLVVLAIEEGEEFGRQTGMSLQTDLKMSPSRTLEDPPRIRRTALCKGWGNELVFRRPISRADLDNDYEFQLGVPAERPVQSSGDISAVLFLDNDNAINGKHGMDASDATTVRVALGNQVMITFVNNATQALPMRIYGHSFVIIRLSGKLIDSGIERDTVLIPPRENVTVSFTALNPGSFPIACMNEFRRAKGMLALLEYVF